MRLADAKNAQDCGGGVSSGYKYAIPMGLVGGRCLFGLQICNPDGIVGGGESSGYKYAITIGLFFLPLCHEFLPDNVRT